MIPTWPQAIEAALANIKRGAPFYVVDFWDQGNWPRWFRWLLKHWLDLFHVKYRPGTAGVSPGARPKRSRYADAQIRRGPLCLPRHVSEAVANRAVRALFFGHHPDSHPSGIGGILDQVFAIFQIIRHEFITGLELLRLFKEGFRMGEFTLPKEGNTVFIEHQEFLLLGW